ncbi:6-hydroxymethylpterin diphosphokinase MptE-like protein [Alkalihalobacterium sp. APHAB7]|uniref:6-hydroxymethylpterin diphosphokinase MptE-like protein n=1 Tax=Alkalihalobacterium sp. APHAB7 TaxID=3402081 RepID=UPI003AAA206C
MFNNKLIKKLKDNKIVVFGTGSFSKMVTGAIFNVSYYVDNNYKKWGRFHQGRRIRSPLDLLNEDSESISILVASVYYEEIKLQLIKLGFIEYKNFFDLGEILNVFDNDNQEEIKKLYLKHKNEVAFIVGNGPSLKLSDLEKLKNSISFGCNQVYLAFGKSSWRPTYYSVIDNMVAKNKSREISCLEVNKFIASDLKSYFTNSKNVLWLRRLPFQYQGKKQVYKFSEDIAQGIYSGFSVVYTQMQIAYYMGFRKLVLLGVDFNYDFTQDTINKKIIVNEQKKNHFHVDYFKNGEKWNKPELKKQYEAFRAAKIFLDEKGVEVVNASRNTQLDIFPTVNYDQVVKEN